MSHNIRFVHSQIGKALQAFKNIAHADLVKSWGRFSQSERCQIARAMLLMENAARKPANYFSYAKTYATWQTRANKFKQGFGLTDDAVAMDAVTNPAEEFFEKVKIVWMNPDLAQKYKKFCELVYLWEYARKSEQSSDVVEKYVDAILFVVAEVCAYQLQILNQKNAFFQKIKMYICR
ncbi:MAG: hypothetical protein R8N24_04170 [Alphaproteobacteria bacterium]|nr:hypothetical protein [Alphaproteobacteria bacterium]